MTGGGGLRKTSRWHCAKGVVRSIISRPSYEFPTDGFFFLSFDRSIGLRILLEDHDGIVGRAKLTELYYLRHEDFQGHPIGRDVIATLWLRLIEASTHTFSSCIYTDLKLKYRVSVPLILFIIYLIHTVCVCVYVLI